MHKNADSLLKCYIAATIGWILCLILTKVIRDWRMNSQLAKNKDSHWKHIQQLDSNKKWLHASYFYSIVHAFTLIVLNVYASFQCEPPTAYRSPEGTFMGNTIYTNDWCVDNANWWECLTVGIFTAYLTVDFFVCYFLIADTSQGAFENYFHHVIGVLGSVSGFIVGRMIMSLSNSTCVTELSTPFVSLRAILSMHKKTDGTLYVINGLLMTLSFFVFRCVFQTWLVTCRLFPAVIYRGGESMSEVDDVTLVICYFSLAMYFSLVGLNFFWFNKMF